MSSYGAVRMYVLQGKKIRFAVTERYNTLTIVYYIEVPDVQDKMPSFFPFF